MWRVREYWSDCMSVMDHRRNTNAGMGPAHQHPESFASVRIPNLTEFDSARVPEHLRPDSVALRMPRLPFRLVLGLASPAQTERDITSLSALPLFGAHCSFPLRRLSLQSHPKLMAEFPSHLSQPDACDARPV